MPASAAMLAIVAVGPSRWGHRGGTFAVHDPVGRVEHGPPPSRPVLQRDGPVVHGIWCPEMARLMISRWISLVPSKIV